MRERERKKEREREREGEDAAIQAHRTMGMSTTSKDWLEAERGRGRERRGERVGGERERERQRSEQRGGEEGRKDEGVIEAHRMIPKMETKRHAHAGARVRALTAWICAGSWSFVQHTVNNMVSTRPQQT